MSQEIELIEELCERAQTHYGTTEHHLSLQTSQEIELIREPGERSETHYGTTEQPVFYRVPEGPEDIMYITDDEFEFIHGRMAKQSICRAPAHMRYSRQWDFEPKLVSIGPYYHGQQSLQPMEDLKARCALELFSKGGHDKHSFSILLHDKFDHLDGQLRLFYKEKFRYDSFEFIWMLGIDSCFIIQIILSFYQEVQAMAFLDVNITEVRSDLLLLENQVPLFFIQEMYDLLRSKALQKMLPPLKTVLEPFLFLDMPWRFNHMGISGKAHHLLHLYWNCSLPTWDIGRGGSMERKEQLTLAEMNLSFHVLNEIPNATVLHRIAGISFETLNYAYSQKNAAPFKKFSEGESESSSDNSNRHKGRWVDRIRPKFIVYKKPKLPIEGLVVTFSNGIIKTPCLKMHSSQTRLLVNLIAFENSMLPHLRFVSSYMKFMDALIDSKKDVELLQQCGVLRNTLSSHEMAATFFNDIGNFCVVDNRENQFSRLHSDVRKYYDSSWNQRRASLRHNYCNSPWAGISVLAGAILLVLTVSQTVYTILGYYYRH